MMMTTIKGSTVAAEGHGHSPIEQFEIRELVPINLFGIDASLTNSGAYMLLALGLIFSFLYFQ